MKIGRGFIGGVIGALTMSAVTGVLRFLGVAVDMQLLLGSLLLGATGPGVWLIGLGIHLLIGGVLGVVYATLFEVAFAEASAGLGVAIGAVHAVIAGIVLAFVPAVHPLIPELLPAPGLFMLELGAFGVVLFVGLHLMYGAIVGAYYGPTLAVQRAPSSFRDRITTHH